ncbi:hypothetical protein [Chlorogloeopsis fritschii]|nr:hypothetical protein [Chlorogloeopsis fritschii]
MLRFQAFNHIAILKIISKVLHLGLTSVRVETGTDVQSLIYSSGGAIA